MGIDVYLRWSKQTKAERQLQMTGFSVTVGNIGYLREAYHGGPYATRVLVPEAFKSDTRRYSARTLRARLPATLYAAAVRSLTVYNETPLAVASVREPKSPEVIHAGDGGAMMTAILGIFAKINDTGEAVPPAVKAEAEATVRLWQAEGKEVLDPTLRSFVEFVELAEHWQAQGRRISVYVSA